MDKRKREIVCGVLFLIIGIALTGITYIGVKGTATDLLGPRFMPYLGSVGTILFSLAVLIPALRMEKVAVDTLKLKQERVKDLRVIIFIIAVLVSLFIIETFGFLPGALFMTTAILLILKVRKPAWFAIIYGSTVAIYLIFTMLIKVTLP